MEENSMQILLKNDGTDNENREDSFRVEPQHRQHENESRIELQETVEVEARLRRSSDGSSATKINQLNGTL